MKKEKIEGPGLDFVIEKVADQGSDSLWLPKLKSLIDEVPEALKVYDELIEAIQNNPKAPESIFHLYSR